MSNWRSKKQMDVKKSIIDYCIKNVGLNYYHVRRMYCEITGLSTRLAFNDLNLYQDFTKIKLLGQKSSGKKKVAPVEKIM
jgi:hypothetical protein